MLPELKVLIYLITKDIDSNLLITEVIKANKDKSIE